MLYFIDSNQVTVYFEDGASAVWKKNHPKFNRIIELCKNSQWIEIEVLHNIPKAIMINETKIEGDTLLVGDVAIDLTEPQEPDESPIVGFIKVLRDKGVVDTDIEAVKPFLKNMFENPHINAPHEIYEYCKALDFEITEDGCFIAYKRVNDNLTSCYDGKTKHIIGQYTEEKKFDTNRNNHCSNGLHFCSKSYLNSYCGAKVIMVKINPKDVVSIPTDYNFAKGRCCKYLTIGEISEHGNLKTTKIGNEKIVKTEKQKKIDKSIAKKTDRIQETADYMKKFKNDKQKVADQMNISVATVERNMRKFKTR